MEVLSGGTCPRSTAAVGVGDGSSVLDFGCGAGSYVLPAARLVGSGRVYALDRKADVLETVKERCKDSGLFNVEVILSENLHTGLPTSSVDTILLFDVIHAVDDIRRLLREMDRVLKPGGMVSVHPMHIGNGEVVRHMNRSGLRLVSEHYKGNVLCFARALGTECVRGPAPLEELPPSPDKGRIRLNGRCDGK